MIRKVEIIEANGAFLPRIWIGRTPYTCTRPFSRMCDAKAALRRLRPYYNACPGATLEWRKDGNIETAKTQVGEYRITEIPMGLVAKWMLWLPGMGSALYDDRGDARKVALLHYHDAIRKHVTENMRTP